jgi:hypothetical protein
MKLLGFFLGIFTLTSAQSAIFTQDHESRVNHLLSVQENLVEKMNLRHAKQGWELARLDVELALSASGELGLVGAGAQGAVELIWERKQTNKDEGETAIIASHDPRVIFQSLKQRVLEELASERMTRRQKRRIFKLLKRDAAEVGRMITELQTMPRVADWYVDGFFKTYYLSKSFGISEIAEVEYDKRIRFRFVFAGPLQRQDIGELSLKQKAHRQVMLMLQGVSNLESTDDKFELSRVWLRSDVTLEKDFILFSTGVGKGFQTVYRRVPPSQRTGTSDFVEPAALGKVVGKLGSFPAGFLRSLKPIKTRQTDIPLSQLRFKFEWSVDSGFSLLSAEKSQVLDLQYFRKESL